MKVEDVKKVGIIGLGSMGTTTAATAALKYQVVVKRRDISKGLGDEGLQQVSRCFPSLVRRNIITEEQQGQAISRVSMTDDFNDLKDCQIIIDAVPDDMGLKIANFATLNKICPFDTVFTTCSACISATPLAAGSGRPDRVLTTHFFNPVHIHPLVELAAAVQTSQETIDFTDAFLREGMGKTVIRVKDSPGLVMDYFLFAYFNHAIKAVEMGLGTAEEIDNIIKLGLGNPMGPFELMDHLGMGQQAPSTKAIYDQTFDKKFAIPPLLVKMVEAGYTGRAVGKGWYTWDERGKKTGLNKIF